MTAALLRLRARWHAPMVALAAIGIASVIVCSPAAAAIRGCFSGRIAFDSLRNGARDIYAIEAPPEPSGKGSLPPWEQPETPPTPTTTPIQITTGPDDAHPSWSPPEPQNECEYPQPEARPRMIAFQRTTADGNTNIYAIDAAKPEPAGRAVPVTQEAGADTAPAWAPWGTVLGEAGSPPDEYPPIAFERSVNGHHDIFIANFDGSDETDLTNSSGADYANPSWAAGRDNESYLTFDSDQGGVREIWVMQVTRSNNHFVGGTPREVTSGQLASSNPSWFVYAPDGNDFSIGKDTLAFAGAEQEGGPSQIDIAESTTLRHSGGTAPFAEPNSIEFDALTNDSCENTAPDWSPKGEFIVYQKTCAGGQSDIYVLNPEASEGSEDIDLTEHVGDNQDPDWEAVQNLGVEYFPVRPHGRRWHKRYTQAAKATTDSISTVGGAGIGGVSDSIQSNAPKGPGMPMPAFAARVKQVVVRGHGHRRELLIVFSVNARATVVGELTKGRRRVASHRWHVSGGTVRLRVRVPAGARPGTYLIRIIVRSGNGAPLTVARRVRIGP
ncbi:MAG TPA: hypothetical protein VK778_07195 [Solirubrobacteraceae bacterium]|nr:hypothetical protein [Solirubrobacteraceae bacterium]